MCFTEEEKNEVFERLLKTEQHSQANETKVAIMDTRMMVSISVASVFMTIIIGMSCWWLNARLSAFDNSVVTMSTITTQLQVMAETVRMHISDADKHTSSIRMEGVTDDVQELEGEVKNMRIEIEMLKKEAQR